MKKVLALVLVAVMAVGMAVSASALTNNGYYEYDELKLGLGYSVEFLGNGDWEPRDSGNNYHNDYLAFQANNEIRPHDEEEIRMYITHAHFQNLMHKNPVGDPNGADTRNPDIRLSATEIRKSKIAVRTQVGAGSKVIKSVAIDAKKGAVVLKFVDEWVSTKDQDFEILVYLTVNGRRMDDYGVTFIGTLENEIIPVYEDYDQVDLSLGYVAEAEDFVPNIEVDLGNGVSIFTKMFKTKKYYGTATRDPDEAADVVMKKYPDIDNVVILKTVGLNSTGDIVKLDTDYSDYYVYDKDLNYVGQSNEMLPYSATYYLANRKLDVEGDEEPDDDDDDVEPDDDDGTNPGTGGDGASSNVNANPGTGR